MVLGTLVSLHTGQFILLFNMAMESSSVENEASEPTLSFLKVIFLWPRRHNLFSTFKA